MPSTTTVLERGRASDLGELRRRAEWIRLKTIELVDLARNGHYGSTFSCAELLATLYYHGLRLDPANPRWPDRDRLLLGKGHVAIGVYPCLADLGLIPEEWLAQYAQLNSPCGDHPDVNLCPGIEYSAGSIGHSLSAGVGMALGGRMQGRDYRTIVLMGDGELNEGQTWEAVMSASHYGLGGLVALIDNNQVSLDGPVEDVMNVEPILDKFRAFGWDTVEFDGHDIDQIVAALDALPPTGSRSPTCLVARTVKGKGIPYMELVAEWHIGWLGPEDKQAAIAAIKERMQ